jgi:nucleotide-binding universal stress UspA family protein
MDRQQAMPQSGVALREDAMTRITRILVPTDFSATSDAALAFARRFAARFGAPLHLVHAFDDPFTTAAFAAEMYTPLPLSMRDEMVRNLRQQLVERLAGDTSPVNGTGEVVTGTTATSIVDYARFIEADLIVMGTHGRSGVAHLLLGSVAERVVRTAECPVLTVRGAPARDTVKHILVPTDFSANSDEALEYAIRLAEPFGAAVQLLHVLHDPFVTEGLAAEAYIAEAPTMRTAMLRNALDRLAHRTTLSRSGVTITSEVLFGHGARTIAEFAAARDVDLIVMGTHGRTGVAHLLLGSVAERVVRIASCPVLTVRQSKVRKEYTPLEYDVEHLPA